MSELHDDIIFLQEEIEGLKAENEKLREALKESLKYFDHHKNIMNPEEGYRKLIEFEQLLNGGGL